MKNIFLPSLSLNGPDFGHGFEPVSGPLQERPPYLFVALSVVIHALVLLVLTSLPKGGAVDLLSVKEKERPFDIEIVQLPETASAMGEPKMPKKITAYAQRTQTVEVEEYPMKIGRSFGPEPARQAGKPSIIFVKPVSKGDGDAYVIKAEPKSPSAPLKKGKELSAGEKAEALNDGDGAITLKRAPRTDTGPLSHSDTVVDAPDSDAVNAKKKHAGTEGGGDHRREGFSFIPSQSALQQIAGRESDVGVESPRAGSGTTLLLNTTDFRFQKYFIAIKRRIQFFWEYPPIAARNGQQGRLKIDFTIQKDGTLKLKDIAIIKSSNYPILDDAATTALRLASPFNPFPEGFELENITVHGSFEYNLYRGR